MSEFFSLDGRGQLALAFAGFAALWLIESAAPFVPRAGRLRHAGRNLLLAAINAAALALVLSGLTVSAAHATGARGWGLLQQVPLPPALGALCGFLILDLWNYAWHRANHRIPFLWRFHRTHHSDPALDVSSATRFHLGEITFSALLRLPLIPLAGLPLYLILVYDLVLLASTQFHHSNVNLPAGADRLLRYAIVSPNMHRVHHSDLPAETHSNYASVLSVWDRIFGTYRERLNCREIRFGLKGFFDERSQSFSGMMRTPLRPLKTRQTPAEPQKAASLRA